MFRRTSTTSFPARTRAAAVLASAVVLVPAAGAFAGSPASSAADPQAASGLAAAGVSAAERSVTVRLRSVGGSGAGGTVTLTARDGGTRARLEVTGLAPGGGAKTFLKAGTFAQPSASFALLPTLRADAAGRATTSGPILFRGVEKIALRTIADGEHILVVKSGGKTIARGIVPKLAA